MEVKRIFYIILGFICMTPFIGKVSAECNYQRLAELSKIATNVKLSYNYDGNAKFTVTLTNITNDIYVIYYNPGILSNVTLSGLNEQSVNIGAGTTLNFNIYSNDPNCYGRKLVTKYISTPFYNYYSNYDECKKYPKFKYCQRWTNLSITNEQFESEFEKYQESLKEHDEKKKNVDVLESIVSFFSQNKWILILLAIVVVIFVILFLIKRVIIRRRY